jgi:DNA-binding IclR family transcriptional regulator
VPSQVGETIDQLLVECLTNGVLLEEDSNPEPRLVATIAAPVFDHDENVVLLVGVHPRVALGLDEVQAIGQRLIRATTALG